MCPRRKGWNDINLLGGGLQNTHAFLLCSVCPLPPPTYILEKYCFFLHCTLDLVFLAPLSKGNLENDNPSPTWALTAGLEPFRSTDSQFPPQPEVFASPCPRVALNSFLPWFLDPF